MGKTVRSQYAIGTVVHRIRPSYLFAPTRAMTDSPPSENLPIQILICDTDVIFRSGLRLWLEQQDGLRVVADTGDGAIARQILQERAAAPAAAVSENAAIDLVVLGLPPLTDLAAELALCRDIAVAYPTLPVLGLDAIAQPVRQIAVQQAGGRGYGPKGGSPSDLVITIRRLVRGQAVWMALPDSALQASDRPVPSNVQPAPRHPVLAFFRRDLRQSGIRQIDAKLTELTHQLLYANLPPLDRAIVEGQCRELRAARWVVNRLLATPSLPPEPGVVETSAEEAQTGRSPVSPARPAAAARSGSPSPPPRSGGSRPSSDGQIDRATTALSAPAPEGSLVEAGVQAVLLDALTTKLQSPLRNQSDRPLEIDILKEERKRELLYLVLRKLVTLLDDLRYSQIQLQQVAERRSQLLVDLWRSALTDFFGKYYVVQVENLELEVVNILSQDAPAVQAAILDRIPAAEDLVLHLLFRGPLLVDGVPQAAGTPEAIARAEALLDNLVIQVANGVIQPLLNRLADVETIKQNFYDRRLISSRDIARFRNDLAWQYRRDRLVTEPIDIFESQYRLLVFQGLGIKTTTIYAPRRQELDQLTGIPFLVTIALEFRDAVSPRLRAVLSFLGSGVIYVLTDVLGRGIGLIGRGIIKGIGSAWQDVRLGREGDRRRS
ncbi:MAG: DUF3685 domain-containing protein [Synechococcales bacterium]|nr:DUF3685 domain-containing protein [Synechococcales bacterium]